MRNENAGTPAGLQEAVGRLAVWWCRRSHSSTTGYWLQMPKASFSSKSAIHDREEYS